MTDYWLVPVLILAACVICFWLFYNRPIPRCSHCGDPAGAVQGDQPLCWKCAELLAARAAIAQRCPCGNHADAVISHYPVCSRCLQQLNGTVASLRFRGMDDLGIIRYLVDAGRDAEAEVLLKKLEERRAAQ